MRYRLTLQVGSMLAVLALGAGSTRAAQISPASAGAPVDPHGLAPIVAGARTARLFPHLRAKLSASAPAEPLDVVVRYKAGREVAAVGIAPRVLAGDHSVAARLTAAEVRALAASEAVESIEENVICHTYRGSAEDSFGTTKASADFGLSGDGDGNPRTFSARDHTIAVIDSGIDARHPDFAGGKVIAWRDFVNGRSQPYDDGGHGTHVASIAAGGIVDGQRGVAPGAALVALKVMDSAGLGNIATIASAVDWCVEHRAQYGIEVINLSLGGSQSADGTDVLCRAVDRATAAGIVVCAAAGNSGPGPNTVGTPAAAATAIAVGNMADLGERGFYLESSSSRGPTLDGRVKPDLCAPGVAIRAAWANTGGYIELTGTSMAAPFVAGVAALMRQASPALTPPQVKEMMKQTAVHFGPAGENNEYGAGRLDGYAAIARALGTVGTPPEAPAHRALDGRLTGVGATQEWYLQVTDTRFPIAVTLLAQDNGALFDLYVQDPAGRRTDSWFGFNRQNTGTFQPERTGVYVVRIRSHNDGGRYALDLSAGASSLPTGVPGGIGVFHPEGTWEFRGSDGRSDSPLAVSLGQGGDLPVARDYLGVGTAQFAVFRPTTGGWLIRKDAANTLSVPFGNPGDIPVPADYLGLGKAQIAVFRPSTGEWHIRKEDGTAIVVPFGAAGDVPVPADYLGLRRAQIAVFRLGTGEWHIRQDDGTAVVVSFGAAGDTPVPGDYFGRGRAQIALFRPTTGEWRLRKDDGTAAVVSFGSAADQPVPADYFDLGRAQIAVFRPATAEWFLRTDTGDTVTIPWGHPGDIPVPVKIGAAL